MRPANVLMGVTTIFLMFSTANADEAPPRFVIRSVTVPDGPTSAIRLDRQTGRSYQPSGNSWRLIAEPEAIPAGRYDVLLMLVGPSWSALRWNVDTGDTWRLHGNTWRKADFVDAPPGGAVPNQLTLLPQ